LSKTFVTRTLIGAPGSTYRYLGLRLFSHPWCDVDERGDGVCRGVVEDGNAIDGGGDSVLSRLVTHLGYAPSCAKALIDLGTINQTLIHRTNNVLTQMIAPTLPNGQPTGSAEYSLTLINRMEPTSIKRDLKMENVHGGLGKTSVSWHKDSGLQDFSSIAVYHTLEGCSHHNGAGTANNYTGGSGEEDIPWRVALRVAEPTTQTPALAIPLPSGSLYYLLDDFNHKHEHAVLAGSNKLRYSSTHRVAREGCGTWQYIRDKCELILSSSNLLSKLISSSSTSNSGRQVVGEVLEEEEVLPPSSLQGRKQLVKEVRSYLKLMSELEFEWIRQWQIQGQHHADLHPYWSGAIHIMTEAYVKLRESCRHIAKLLKQSSSSKAPSSSNYKHNSITNIISEDLFDVVIEAITDHHRLSSTWRQRLRDPIFATLVKEMRPIVSTIFDVEEDQQKDGVSLLNTSDVRKWRSGFVALRDGTSGSSGGDDGGLATHNHGTVDTKRKKKKKKATKSSQRSTKESSMTKKERKKVASNWERMKAQMKH